jgi:hypothetical protein
MAKFFPDKHFGIRWYLNILKLPKRLDVGPYQVRVFIDLPSATVHTSLSSPNYAGSVFVFARSRDSNCKTCEKVPYACGSVELTTTMKTLGIVVDTEVQGVISNENPPTDPFKNNLQKFTLVYVTAAGKEFKLDEKLSDDSNGTHKTQPTFYVGWMAFTDAKSIASGDMKPQKLNELFKSSRTAASSKMPYMGGIIEQRASS